MDGRRPGFVPRRPTAVETTELLGSTLYRAAQNAQLPDGALLASLGCRNPTALAELTPGEVVLDLGSGGGIDVLPPVRGW